MIQSQFTLHRVKGVKDHYLSDHLPHTTKRLKMHYTFSQRRWTYTPYSSFTYPRIHKCSGCVQNTVHTGCFFSEPVSFSLKLACTLPMRESCGSRQRLTIVLIMGYIAVVCLLSWCAQCAHFFLVFLPKSIVACDAPSCVGVVAVIYYEICCA